MSYEGFDLTIDTYIKESFKEVVMIMRLTIYTFRFFSFNFSPNEL
jgi:hypothetical protein